MSGYRSIPPTFRAVLLPQVCLELIEMRETELAREMLRTTEPLQLLKTQDPDRYFRLETFLNRKIHDAQELYAYGLNKERRRQEIADSLAVEVSVVPPSRLLALLQQALRFQQLQGNLPKDRRYDLFRGSARSAGKDEAERPPKKQVLTCLFSSPCGRYPDLLDFFWKTPSWVPLPRPLPRSSCILRFPFLFVPLPPPPPFPPPQLYFFTGGTNQIWLQNPPGVRAFLP
jgi:hypothetical protein